MPQVQNDARQRGAAGAESQRHHGMARRQGSGNGTDPFLSFAPILRGQLFGVYPEIDFFNSIGRLPIPLLNAVWYTGEGGERSVCRGARALDTDAWRQKYWESFQSGATRKTSEWAHEQEHRLLLWSSMDSFKDKASRKLNYKFSDLSGIIFGARTATVDKLKTMRIVEAKCRAENRTDLNSIRCSIPARTGLSG